MATIDQLETAIHIGPRVRALREAMDLVAARPRRAQRRQRADALPGRARRDQPDARVAARIAAGLELRLCSCCGSTRAAPSSIVRAGERRRGGGAAATRYEVLTPPLPGQRAELSPPRAGARRHDRRHGRPADARARQPRDRAGRGRHASCCIVDGADHELREGDSVTFDADLPHHFENPGPGEAALLAVVSAGLRRT